MISKVTQFLQWVLEIPEKVEAHKRVRLWASLGLGLVFIIFIGWITVKDWNQIKTIHIVFNSKYLLFSILLFGANYCILALSWNLLMRNFDQKIKWNDHLLNYAFSYLARFFPTPAFFLVTRTVNYRKVGLPKRIIFLSTAMEIILHILTGLSVLLIISVNPNKPWTIFWVTIPIIPLFLFVLFPNLFQPGLSSSKAYPNDRKVIFTNALLVLLLFLTWLISGYFFLFVIRAVVPDPIISLQESWKVWIISSVISYLSAFTLGGIGFLREFSISFFLLTWFPPPTALLITISVRLILTLGGTIWSGLAIGLVKFLAQFRFRQHNEIEQNK